MTHSQNMPSIRRATVRRPLEASDIAWTGSTLTTVTSYPADSITSLTSGISFLLSTTKVAELPKRLTETSVMPPSSETNLVMVEEHETQVIPPMERETWRGPSIWVLAISVSEGLTNTMLASYPMALIVSSTSLVTVLLSKVTTAEFSRSETDTSRTPDRPDSAAVTVLRHDAQVIPPTESVR